MRLFLNSGTYRNYRRHFDARHGTLDHFQKRCEAYLDDRYGAAHILKPVLERDPSAFFTCGDDECLQHAWANEHGVKWTGKLSDVLLAQIEEHRTELFYNLDPMRFGSEFVKRLPGCVRHAVCWRAAPSPGADFSAYDLIVCNFPSIISFWRQQGWHADYFSPAHDPVLDQYSNRENRPIDVCFVGGYSRHHQNRSEVLEAVAGLSGRFNIRYYLNQSRSTRLAEHPIAKLLPLERHRRTHGIKSVSMTPVFGQDLYEVLGSSKIVLNGAIDMAGNDRGNMRCFEAMGSGDLLVSDAGLYPEGMRPGENMLIYSSAREAVRVIERALRNWSDYAGMAADARQMVRSMYSKERQWNEFKRLVDSI